MGEKEPHWEVLGRTCSHWSGKPASGLPHFRLWVRESRDGVRLKMIEKLSSLAFSLTCSFSRCRDSPRMERHSNIQACSKTSSQRLMKRAAPPHLATHLVTSTAALPSIHWIETETASEWKCKGKGSCWLECLQCSSSPPSFLFHSIPLKRSNGGR